RSRGAVGATAGRYPGRWLPRAPRPGPRRLDRARPRALPRGGWRRPPGGERPSRSGPRSPARLRDRQGALRVRVRDPIPALMAVRPDRRLAGAFRGRRRRGGGVAVAMTADRVERLV